MPDMLCSLLKLEPIAPRLQSLREHGVTIRRPNPWEQTALREFIRDHFTQGWADEVSVAFSHQPVSAFVALRENKHIVGFAAYECTRRNYFGPTGVAEEERGIGIGAALTLAGLIGLREMGYAYCVIGGAGPLEFYNKLARAQVIDIDKGEGIYHLDEEPGWGSTNE